MLLVSIIIGILILFPFIITISVLIYGKKRGKAPVKLLGKAADWTTPLLFISVYIIAQTIFEDYVMYFIFIPFILLVIILSIKERMNEKEFQIQRVLRKVWRISFVVLLILYIALLITGITLEFIAHFTE